MFFIFSGEAAVPARSSFDGQERELRASRPILAYSYGTQSFVTQDMQNHASQPKSFSQTLAVFKRQPKKFFSQTLAVFQRQPKKFS